MTSVLRNHVAERSATWEAGMAVTRDVVRYQHGDPPLTSGEGWALTQRYARVHRILALSGDASPLAAVTRATGAYTTPPGMMAAVVRIWRAMDGAERRRLTMQAMRVRRRLRQVATARKPPESGA
jgi:hypothetical protein